MKPVNTALLTFNKRVSGDTGKKIVSNINNLEQSAKKAQKSVSGLGKTLTSTGKTGAAATQKISIGFTGLAKALVAREIVQALNRIKQALLDTADAAAEFELDVARISNIAQGPNSSIAELTESLANLSIELGRPITEVTEAAFEALQNDLGNTAETMDLLTGSAQDLALITDGTLTQAVNSISSVLKAYNLDISEAGNVTDIFFAAIDKGRITLSELESSLGKITPLAARLDIDFAQVAAAMAAITQSGTSASVANTQLRSILQKLIKPTEQLQGAFTKLGVTTFNELIARSGSLQTALDSIAGALNNDERAIASAFGRLRAQLGVFNLLANEGKIFSDTLDVVTDSFGRSSAAADVLRDTDAFRAQKEAEEFNKTMREIGESMLRTKTAFLEFANEVLPAGEKIATVIGTIAKLAIGLGGTAVIVALSSLSAGVLALSVALALASAAGFALGEALNFDIFSSKLDEFVAEVEKTNKELVEATSKTVLEGNAAIETALNRRGKDFEKYIEGLETAFEKETAIIRKASKIASQALSDSFQDFADGFDDVFNSIDKKVKGFNKAMKTAKKNIRDSKKELEDFKFDADGETLSDAQQFNRELEKSEKEGKELADALKDANLNPENAEIARELAENLKKSASEQRKEVKEIKNAFNARKLLEVSTANQLAALEALVKLDQVVVDTLEAQAEIDKDSLNRNKRIGEEIKEQAVVLKAQLETLLSINALTDPKGFKEAKENVQDTINGIKDLKGELDQGIFEKFGEDENVKKLFDGVNEAIAKATFDFAKVQEDLAKKLAEPEYKVFVDILSNLPEFEGKLGDLIQDIQNASDNPITVTEDIRDTLGKELQKQTEAQNNLAGQTEQVLKSNDETNSLVASALSADAGKNTEFIKAFQTEIARIQELLLDPTLKPEQIEGLKGKLNSLAGQIQEALKADEKTLGDSIAKALQTAINTALTAIEAKEAALKFSVQFDEAEITKINAAILLIDGNIETAKKSQDAVTKATEGTTTAQKSLDTQIKVVIDTTNTAVGRMNALATAAREAATAIRDANTATANSHHGGVPHKKAGGVAFRQSGGRGLDTQPAMLSRGEFVMNARSARRFFPQMSAMNAGQEPAFRDQGGSVTNIGDINVNVTGTGSESPELAGRQIASSLRRELRRKTSTI